MSDGFGFALCRARLSAQAQQPFVQREREVLRLLSDPGDPSSQRTILFAAADFLGAGERAVRRHNTTAAELATETDPNLSRLAGSTCCDVSIPLLAAGHPLLVQCYGTAQDEASLYVAFKPCLGGDFCLALQRLRRMAVPMARFYLAEIVTALEVRADIRHLVVTLSSFVVVLAQDICT